MKRKFERFCSAIGCYKFLYLIKKRKNQLFSIISVIVVVIIIFAFLIVKNETQIIHPDTTKIKEEEISMLQVIVHFVK